MGQQNCKTYTPPPLSLQDCLVDGRIDPARYRMYSKKMYTSDYIDNEDLNHNNKKRNIDELDIHPIKKEVFRSVKKHKHLKRNIDGSLEEVTFKDSMWYVLYVREEPRNDRLANLFRNRFRLPYKEYEKLCNQLSVDPLFQRWNVDDCTGCPSSDIRVLLLGSLRYLGRAHTFDDIEESTFISREVHRIFLHTFLDYGSTNLYKKYVTDAATHVHVSDFEKIFAMADFDGCVGSSDATHIGMLSCPVWASNNHKGHKLAVPSRNYNATVTHAQQILSTTFGHPGAWNDKTIVLYNDLIRGVHENKTLSNFEFKLYEKNYQGEIDQVVYKGAWFIVDNGYLAWSCTVPPKKHPLSYEDIRFSEWMESVRKDVECTFGILKGRFAILRYGLRFAKISSCDKLWLTCCALHNMLLFVDGLDKNWENGVKSFYENENDDDEMNVAPFAINRLNRNLVGSEVEVQNVVIENNSVTNSNINFSKYTVDGKRVVSMLPLDLFQERLIHHFDIRFKRNDLQWPNRTRTSRTI